jgi:hypothetical protein
MIPGKNGPFIVDVHPGERPNWHFVIRWTGNGSMICKSVNYYGQRAAMKAATRFVEAMRMFNHV